MMKMSTFQRLSKFYKFPRMTLEIFRFLVHEKNHGAIRFIDFAFWFTHKLEMAFPSSPQIANFAIYRNSFPCLHAHGAT